LRNRARDREVRSRTVLTSVVTCPHGGHERTETMPTNPCVHFSSARGAARSSRQSLGIAASSVHMAQADVRPDRMKGA